MSISRGRVRAVARKELREFQRNRSLIFGMAIVPAIFCVQPLLAVFTLDSSTSNDLRHLHVLLYMLAIPALVPSFLAAYSVVGERQQGTLEPMLTTPVRREELLLGKALATLVPSTAVAYVVYGLFLASVELFAQPAVAAALIPPPRPAGSACLHPAARRMDNLARYTDLHEASDVRVAQQLSAPASLPSIALTTLIALNIITTSQTTDVVAAAALLLLNRLGWRFAAAAFDRERLVTGGA